MKLFYSHPELSIFASTLCLSGYYTIMKRFKEHSMIMFFWLHIISYTTFALLFLHKDKAFVFDTDALEQLIFNTSYNNVLLYILASVCLVGTYQIFQLLIQKYEMFAILALSQISVIFSTIGYILLGDDVSLVSIVGIIIIALGALIAGSNNLSWKSPIKTIKNYDTYLLKYTCLNGLLTTCIAMITYLCTTEYSDITRSILHTLTKYTHFIPFVALSPIHFNIGAEFSNIIIMLLFITYYTHKQKLILPILKNHIIFFIIMGILYTMHAFLYYSAFDFIENKNIISAITSLALPITMITSHYYADIKVSQNQIIGMTVITLGSIVSIWI